MNPIDITILIPPYQSDKVFLNKDIINVEH